VLIVFVSPQIGKPLLTRRELLSMLESIALAESTQTKHRMAAPALGKVDGGIRAFHSCIMSRWSLSSQMTTLRANPSF
jgi:hypothetical protein